MWKKQKVKQTCKSRQATQNKNLWVVVSSCLINNGNTKLSISHLRFSWSAGQIFSFPQLHANERSRTPVVRCETNIKNRKKGCNFLSENSSFPVLPFASSKQFCAHFTCFWLITTSFCLPSSIFWSQETNNWESISWLIKRLSKKWSLCFLGPFLSVPLHFLLVFVPFFSFD